MVKKVQILIQAKMWKATLGFLIMLFLTSCTPDLAKYSTQKPPPTQDWDYYEYHNHGQHGHYHGRFFKASP